MLQKHRDKHKHTEYKQKHLKANCTEVLNKNSKISSYRSKKINQNKPITNKTNVSESEPMLPPTLCKLPLKIFSPFLTRMAKVLELVGLGV